MLSNVLDGKIYLLICYLQNVSFEARYRFLPLQNVQNEALDKEAKNYKEKETLQHRHQNHGSIKQKHQIKLSKIIKNQSNQKKSKKK